MQKQIPLCIHASNHTSYLHHNSSSKIKRKGKLLPFDTFDVNYLDLGLFILYSLVDLLNFKRLGNFILVDSNACLPIRNFNQRSLKIFRLFESEEVILRWISWSRIITCWNILRPYILNHGVDGFGLDDLCFDIWRSH